MKQILFLFLLLSFTIHPQETKPILLRVTAVGQGTPDGEITEVVKGNQLMKVDNNLITVYTDTETLLWYCYGTPWDGGEVGWASKAIDNAGIETLVVITPAGEKEIIVAIKYTQGVIYFYCIKEN